MNASQSSRFEMMEEIHDDRVNQIIKESGDNISHGVISSNSSDGGREARISLRKNRIEQNRLARAKPSGQQDDLGSRRAKKVEVENRDLGKAKSQISISRKRIDGTRETGNEMVTNIRTGVIARESLVRHDQTRLKDVWKGREQEERSLTQAAGEILSAEWESVEKLTGPYELQKLLEKQKVACEELIQIKNGLINDYINELKSKDDEYVRELKRQAEEIDKLLDRMENKYKSYQIALVEEIEQIESSFVEERTEMISINLKDVEKLFENRRMNETRFMDDRSKRIEDYLKQLEQLRVSDSEEYNLVKIKLETDVQVLEQQLQQMRVTYQLNTEKLEYNYQVLKKREEENGTILGAQKRKINRLADHLNLLKIKSVKQEKLFQQENSSLTDDYKHLTEQYKELQKKFRHFQVADSKKFKEIWKMNEEEAKEIMRKVLQADRIIHEMQLGIEWENKHDDLFRNVDPLFFRESIGLSSNNPEVAYEKQMTEKVDPKANGDEQNESLAAKFQDHKSNSKTMKKTLELLCNEAGFLVEDRLQKLLAPLHKDEQSLMRLDSIFKALGVETVDDIERLTSYFVKDDTISETDRDKTKSQLIAEDNAQLIKPEEVVIAIRKFTEENRKGINLNGMEITTVGEIDDGIPGQPIENKSRGQLQKEYWERMSDVIDDKSYRTWAAVYTGMEKYHSLLSQRWQVSQKICTVQQQNSELKSLLRQYMAARVNDELQIPPTQIMLAQAGMLTE